MSYFVTVRETTKAAAIDAVTGEVGKVAAENSIHKDDEPKIVAMAAELIDMMDDGGTNEIGVTICVTIGSTGHNEGKHIGASIATQLYPGPAPKY